MALERAPPNPVAKWHRRYGRTNVGITFHQCHSTRRASRIQKTPSRVFSRCTTAGRARQEHKRTTISAYPTPRVLQVKTDQPAARGSAHTGTQLILALRYRFKLLQNECADAPSRTTHVRASVFYPVEHRLSSGLSRFKNFSIEPLDFFGSRPQHQGSQDRLRRSVGGV